jgi:N-methylhydantoinase B/oxoprolinase/acetone carboxylase alpha subunit
VSQEDLEAVKTVLQTAIDSVKADLEKELKTANDAIEDLKTRVAALENPA